MSLYDSTLPRMAHMLRNVLRWLDEAAAYAETRKFDPDPLLTARLAPDQFPLVRQLQSACDISKFCAARLGGKTPPKHPDTEATFAEIRVRIEAVLAYLKGFGPEDFAGADERVVALPFMPGKGMVGSVYAHEFALPNFYFHVTTAYAILRHNGVSLGKMAYLGPIDLVDV